jgi:uncharacterized membrane protein
MIGIVLFAATPESHGDTAMPFKDLLVGLKSFSPPSITAFGVLLVIASPFVWVGSAITSFAMGRNAFYSSLSLLVLLIMLLSIVVAFT